MKFIRIISITILFLASATTAAAHQLGQIEHSHVYRQAGYGVHRQGHSVNGQFGNIMIWSAQPYTGYQGTKNVRFARPQPITRPLSSPAAPVTSRAANVMDFGKAYKPVHGKP